MRSSHSATALAVELKEDPFPAVLGGDGPRGPGRAGQRCEPPRQVPDPIHVVDPGEADERVHLAQALHGQHPGDQRTAGSGRGPASTASGRSPGPPDAGRSGRAAGSPIRGRAGSTGSQSRMRFSCSSGSAGGRSAAASSSANAVSVRSVTSTLPSQQVSEHAEVVAILGQLVAQGEPDPVGEVAGFCSAVDSGMTMTDCVAGNHRFDAPTRISRVSFGQPVGVERVQVRMTPPAPRQLRPPGLALRLVHGPAQVAGRALR